ncbi:MAG: glycosyltransferase family 4 protein [Erysipelotrichaceae bacterium]|nr:glycosyltransferase family 4 protein [Erysipelotrichaceae bacterium]
MKILLISQYYYPENVVISKIMERLASFGHEVVVLTAKPNYGFDKILEEYKKIRYEEINGVKVHRIKIYPRKQSRTSIYYNYLSFFFRGKKAARRLNFEPDVVLSSSLSPVISISPAIAFKKKHHVPLALQLLDLWPESITIARNISKKGFIYRLFAKWSRSIYAQCDDIYVSSPAFITYLKDELKLDVSNVKHIYQPSIIENSKVSPFIFKSGINIVYVGNISEVQKISYLLRLGDFFKENQIRLHLVGMGSYTKTMKQEIAERQLEEVIIYHGPVPIEFATRYFINADALYLSLTNQGTVGKTIPSKLTTYMAFKKPIIAMISGNGKELLEKANGALISDFSLESLKKTFADFLLLSNEAKDKMGQNNFEYYQQNISIERVSREFEVSLTTLVNSKKR